MFLRLSKLLPLTLVAACASLPEAGVGENNLDTASLSAECQTAYTLHDEIVLGSRVESIKLNHSMDELSTAMLEGGEADYSDADSAGESCIVYSKDIAKGTLCHKNGTQTMYEIEVDLDGFTVVFASQGSSSFVEVITIYDQSGYLLSEISGDPERNNDLTGCKFFKDNCEHSIFIEPGHTDLTKDKNCLSLADSPT